MNRKRLVAAISSCSLGLLLAGSAYAQDPAAQPPEQPGSSEPAAPMDGTQAPALGTADRETGMAAEQQAAPIGDAKMTAAQLLDKSVRNAQDEELGTVQNLLISADGRITHAIVGQGGVLGVGQELYAVPFERLEISQDQQVVVNVPKDQFASEFSAFEQEQVGGGDAESAAGTPGAESEPQAGGETGAPQPQ